MKTKIPMHRLKEILKLLQKAKTNGISNKELKKSLPEAFPGDIMDKDKRRKK